MPGRYLPVSVYRYLAGNQLACLVTIIIIVKVSGRSSVL